MKARHPFADRQTINIRNPNLITLFDLVEMLAKLLKITLIISQRVRADIALVSEVLEKLFEEIVEHFLSDRRLPACNAACGVTTLPKNALN